MKIPFNKPYMTGKELEYISQAHANGHLSGDGPFTKKCHEWLEKRIGCKKALLTHSGTAALEMAAILADLKPGDEVIMPSYTFVSTANAFALRGAKIAFIDIRPDTMNIDETLIEQAITDKTKAIVPVHYAGVACEMEPIMEISLEYDLLVIEDAAQGLISTSRGRFLGTIGHIGCYSFHETKNCHCGEGGAILLNDEKFKARAEIIREKGTNRSRFFRGQVDKYTWVDIGSSYLPSELNAAFLYAQLEKAKGITEKRLKNWNLYYEGLKPLAIKGLIELPFIPNQCKHNGHMFFIKVKDINERNNLLAYLKKNGILGVFHYVPLHSSEAGMKFGSFSGEDKWTTIESERLIRLPMYYELGKKDIGRIIKTIERFYA
ncbi:dTDP-4-amino-4,6-dideoxygalactose transaminase [uncultured archaeon]|nr:dTDP-4-amino-4,6-dideoxygalactose transaminase [uncultured archaeon]